MEITENSKEFLLWFETLQQLSKKNDSQWLVSNTPGTHFKAFKTGLKPEEELAELEEIAQWRGCGCGGS